MVRHERTHGRESTLPGSPRPQLQRCGRTVRTRVVHLKSLGISLRSATEPIDDTSTGKLMEGVLAAFAQFDNDVRSERTLAGMRLRCHLDVGRSRRRSAT